MQAQSQMNPSLYKKQPWRWMVEHVIFPTLKTDFIPPRKMAEDGSILQIADLHDLYKVFERCWLLADNSPAQQQLINSMWLLQ